MLGKRGKGGGKPKEKQVGAAGHTICTQTCIPALMFEQLLGKLGSTTMQPLYSQIMVPEGNTRLSHAGLCTPEGWRALVAEYRMRRGLGAVISRSLRAMAVAHDAAEEPHCLQPCMVGCPCPTPFSPWAGSWSCRRRLQGWNRFEERGGWPCYAGAAEMALYSLVSPIP